MVKLITGRAGSPHITSADDGELYKHLTKAGDYVTTQDLPKVTDSNGVVINDGVTEKDVSGDITVNVVGGAFLMCSRFVRNINSTEIVLPAGIVGESVTKYIGLKYTLNDDIENVEMVLSASKENNSTIYDDATEYFMPLFEVKYIDTSVTISNCYAGIESVVSAQNSLGTYDIVLPEVEDEKRITFKSPDGSKNAHDISICGGNANSDTVLGVYDNINKNFVWRYLKGKLVDANTNLIEKNIVSAYLGSDTTLTSTNRTMLKVNKTACKVGNRLTITDNGVKIGAGVRYVKVGGNAYFYTGTINAMKTATICKYKASDGSLTEAVVVNIRPTVQNIHIPLPEKVFEVAEGDAVRLYITGASGDLIKSYHNGTFLTVEVMG